MGFPFAESRGDPEPADDWLIRSFTSNFEAVTGSSTDSASSARSYTVLVESLVNDRISSFAFA
jgi:hypothetical protein